MKPVILVSGPTASGKSDLAIYIAQSLNGEIINIDSVQIYKHFNIGSAKIPKEQQRGVRHHLLDLKEPGDSVDAGWYIKEAKACIEEIQSRGKTCVLCAGTTMYITLLFHGLAALPSANEEIRSKLKECSLEELCRRLSEKDPETAAKIHLNDRIRIERALEIFELSGIKASELQAAHNFSGSDLKGIFLILGWPRDKLYERINIRSRGMFDNGLLEETKGIVDRCGSDLFPMKSLGYAQALKVLNGTIGIEEALSELQQETRNFAKRQYTFWRNEASKRGWKVHPGIGEDGLELRSHDDFYKSHKRVNELRVCDYSFSELLQMLQAQSTRTLERNEVYYLNAQNFETPIY